MKKINSLRFLIVLMVVGLTVGCAKQCQEVLGELEIMKLDGENYSVSLAYLKVDSQGHVISSSTMVWPYDEKDTGLRVTPHSAQEPKIATIKVDGKERAAKPDTLYFLRDGKIKFEKEYRDLEIDIPSLNAGGLVYLRPILEKVIRENVTPQEDTTEE